jgi:acetoacetyl-CoA synthetase
MLLKSGTLEPPVFIAPGLGSDVTELLPLVEHIRSARSVYGLQARGIDGMDEPFERIEDMAQFHLREIKQVQPHGPYLLIGYSLGGLVMLELAQRLSENGDKVELLALLESYPHSRFLSLRQRRQLFTRLTKHHISTALRLPIREAFSYIIRLSARQLHNSREGQGSMQDREASAVTFSPAVARVRTSAYRALKRYRPRFYKGRIRFVRAGTSTEFPEDAVAVWANLVDEFEVETVPGDHHEIIIKHFESLADVLSRYLSETSDQN